MRSTLTVFINEIRKLVREYEAKKILFASLVNVIGTCMMFIWCNSTNSMALTAFTYLTLFDTLSLATCLITLWVSKQHPTSVFSFGFERLEVLAVFSNTVLAMFGSLFIIKESAERLLIQPEIHSGRLIYGTVTGFVTHLCLTYTISNPAFNHVVQASSSSWLQEHVADMSQSLCSVVPGLDKILLPRINASVLIGAACTLAVLTVHLSIEISNYFFVDTLAAMCIALMTCGTMFPMAVYTGRILLQTTPSYVIGQLDKCLREASTLDGVLEFRNEHFWTVSFGDLAGSVQVRVRRDANEQLVLAHVVNRLSNVVSTLTVQIVKDDWTKLTSTKFTKPINTAHFNLPVSAGGGGASDYFSKTTNSRIPLISHPVPQIIPSYPLSPSCSSSVNNHTHVSNPISQLQNINTPSTSTVNNHLKH